jgi:tripartite-type tricarboxylate transporter receptor subunit TctC
LPYEPLADFQPVASAGEGLVVIVAGPRVKAKNFQAFVDETKQRKVFFATSGPGSLGHLLGEAMNLSVGIETTAVHYKSGSESLVDIAGGRADVYVGVLPAVLPLLESGKVRLLATMNRERVDAYPDVPTLSELGYANAEIAAWWGVFVPDGTPDDVVNKLNADVQAVLSMPEYNKFLESNEAALFPQTPANFKEFIIKDIEFWKKVAKERGIEQK